MTSELAKCQKILVNMTMEVEEVLPFYLACHQSGLQQHDVAEVQLFCRNLRHRLESWSAEEQDVHETGDDRLAHLFDAAEQCDRLASVLSQHRGDARLDHALERLAECLRLASPGVLRWAHGVRGGKAPAFLASREKLVHQNLASLLKSLQAA